MLDISPGPVSSIVTHMKSNITITYIYCTREIWPTWTPSWRWHPEQSMHRRAPYDIEAHWGFILLQSTQREFPSMFLRIFRHEGGNRRCLAGVSWFLLSSNSSSNSNLLNSPNSFAAREMSDDCIGLPDSIFSVKPHKFPNFSVQRGVENFSETTCAAKASYQRHHSSKTIVIGTEIFHFSRKITWFRKWRTL